MQTPTEDKRQRNNTIVRYQNPQTAEDVASILRDLTNGITIEVHPIPFTPVSEHDKKVGKWAITTFEALNVTGLSRMQKAIEQAQTLALAMELERHSPNNYMLETWGLNPNNRYSMEKRTFTDDDFVIS
jgi:hypothetical protein